MWTGEDKEQTYRAAWIGGLGNIEFPWLHWFHLHNSWLISLLFLILHPFSSLLCSWSSSLDAIISGFICFNRLCQMWWDPLLYPCRLWSWDWMLFPLSGQSIRQGQVARVTALAHFIGKPGPIEPLIWKISVLIWMDVKGCQYTNSSL